MNKRTTKRIREMAFDTYRDNPDAYSSNTNCFREAKRIYNNGLLRSQKPKLKLSRRQQRFSAVVK